MKALAWRADLIRGARREDGAAILQMLVELAAWEGATHAPRLSAAILDRDVFGEKPKLRILVAENEGAELAGLISYYENYSSWEGGAGIHIGDLWVSPSYRGRGIGAALLSQVTSAHAERRVDVFVMRGNKARSFYEHLGFREQTEWVLYRKRPRPGGVSTFEG